MSQGCAPMRAEMRANRGKTLPIYVIWTLTAWCRDNVFSCQFASVFGPLSTSPNLTDRIS